MSKRQQQGSSLVEVMVALFVLAIGLLGVLAMQSKSMQYNQSAHTYSQAVYLANDMAERIRSNFSQAAAYVITADAAASATAPSPKCDQNPCDAAELVAWDTYEWTQKVRDFLPVGEAAITQVNAAGATPSYLRIKVAFDDSRVAEGTVGKQEYVLAVEL